MRTLALAGIMGVLAALMSCARFAAGHDPGSRPHVGTFFVATNGNDSWSGTIAGPDKHGTNGPFRTLTRALEAAVELKKEQGGNWRQPVTIFLRGGMHWLSEPVVIKPEHSGTAATPLLIAAYGREEPILSGGKPVSGWQPVRTGSHELWAAELPESRDDGWFFRQLWVHGERRIRARHPNRDYFKVAALPDTTPRWQDGHKRFQFNAGDLKDWKSVTQGEVVVMTRWVESRMPIAGVDESKRLVDSTKRSVFQLQAGDLYYVEHVFDVLDQPGEWFLDRERGMLFYFPFPGETLDDFVAIAPKLIECVRIEGRPDRNRFVEHVQFRGLTFSHNEWFFPPGSAGAPEREVLGFSQAASGVTAVVNADGARNCSFERCRFVNVGSYGLQLARGCQHNRIAACEFFDLAGGGIKLGETSMRTNLLEQTHSNEITDCRIGEGGRMFHSSIGLWVGQSFNNRIAHNRIHDFYYTGISIGWTWGYGKSLASNNVVEFNHVHHIGRKSNGDGPILSDMGGIYTLGVQPGTTIRNNLWHDIHGLRYGGWGIYFDEGSTGIVAENNVVLRTTHGGFHQHYGRENIVRNNVLAFGRNHQLQRTRAEEHLSFTFEKNIVYFDEGKLFDGNWTGGKLNLNHNVYFDARSRAVLNFPGGLENWRKNGRDINSEIANPHFATTNFAIVELQPASPALRLGFQPFSLDRVGPRQSLD